MSTTNAQGKRRLVLRLWEANPLCAICECPLVCIFRSQEHFYGRGADKIKRRDDEATIYFIETGYQREHSKNRRHAKVLACNRCVEEQSHKANLEQSIDDLHKRAGHAERFANTGEGKT